MNEDLPPIDVPAIPEVQMGVGKNLSHKVKGRLTLSAIITRADGTIEDLGVIAESEEE